MANGTVAVGLDHTFTQDESFLGHPRGLAYLAFTEAWERFSYYGMTALVVLYMVQELYLPGHIENVVGMATYRSILEGIFGPMSTQALASQTFGLYSGFVYFTPILGGLVADRWLGAKNTVLIGAGLMTMGHLAMAFEQSFLLALLLLVLGSGCLKGNIAAQVGHLYAKDDVSRRTRGYTIFSTGINIGAVIGPIVCGALAQIYGWHVGFGTAGLLMLLACIVYVAGRKHLPDERPRTRQRIASEPLSQFELRTLALLAAVMVITLCQSMAYLQLFNVGLVWVSGHVDMSTPIGSVPVPWLNSIDALFSILIAPVLVALWHAQALRGKEPGDIAKMSIGALIMAASSALLAVAAYLAGEGKTGVFLPFIAYAVAGIAFMWQWPTLLALISRRAPKSINAMMMGFAYLTLFVSSLAMGYFGSFYEKMSPAEFWSLNATIAGFGAGIIFVFGRRLKRALS